VVRGVDELMLSFGFMDESPGQAQSLCFLTSMAPELRDYTPTLRAYLENHGGDMPFSGRLALESGVLSYESLLRWARDAIANYEERKGRRRS